MQAVSRDVIWVLSQIRVTFGSTPAEKVIETSDVSDVGLEISRTAPD
jgi:hypothetical protein